LSLFPINNNDSGIRDYFKHHQSGLINSARSFEEVIQPSKDIHAVDKCGEIDQVPAEDRGGSKMVSELELISNILKSFNDQFGNT